MDTYSFLRELADSWILLAMFCFFLAVILWAFRPGGSVTYDAIAQIPLRDEGPENLTCQNCEGCASRKGADHV